MDPDVWARKNAWDLAHAYREQYAVPVICELCLSKQHGTCVKPCTCKHERPMAARGCP